MARTTKYAWVLKHYVDLGWEIDVVERTYSFGQPGGQRKAQSFDLFGFGDLYGYRLREHLIVQATTDRDHAGHEKALLANPAVLRWIGASPYNHVELISEHRDKRSPGKLGQVRIRAITLADFV